MPCDNIKVAIRLRPLIEAEKRKGLKVQWSVSENNIFQVDDNGQRNSEPYSFDHIFDVNKSNRAIYNDVVDKFVTATVEGLNATIFAYGQTSSGKTYTMFGTPNEPGITDLAIENLFESIANCKNRRFLVRVSCIEIYNEKINDLLEPNNKDIRIREDLSGNINLQGVREEIVSNKAQIFEFIKMGSTNRRIAGTNMNERSSRSHTIFKIMVESTETNNDTPALTSNLNLVDLAGSERVAQTRATGVRLIEGGHINKSLSALGLVIRQLSDGQEFVNFRDSKLTRLLQHSLGGNAKTLIIGTITLASTEDTHSTLAFAQRAKAVKNKPEINEILTESDMTKRYAQLYNEHKQKLQEQLSVNKNLEVNYFVKLFFGLIISFCEHEREESSKVISLLTEQIKMLEIFQRGKTIEPALNPIKRRHTIGYVRPPLLNAITEEVTYDVIPEEVENCESETESSDALSDEPASPSNCSTPKSALRDRLHYLKKEYDELLSFTQHEKELGETSRKNLLLNYENQLNVSTTNRNVNCDLLEEPRYIMKELFRLKEILQNETSKIPNKTLNESGIEEERDAMLDVMDNVNSKMHLSQEIMKNEILKQMNNFSQLNEKLNESIIVPNDLASFNDLINEFSAFDTDFHNVSRGGEDDTIENQKQNMENLKYLRNVYESLSKKNELIGRCYKKIMLLQEKLNLSTNMDNLEDEDLSIREVIGKLQSDSRNKVTEFGQDAENFGTTDKDLCGKIKILEDERISDKATIAQLQNQLDQYTAKNLESNKNLIEHRQKNEDLIMQIKSLQDESVSNQFLANKYKTKFTECLASINQYQEENKKLTTKINSLEKEYKLNKEEIHKTPDCSNEQSNFAELEKSNQNLIIKIKSLEEDNYVNQVAMERIVEELTANIKELELDSDLNKKEIDRLKTLVDNYKIKYSESLNDHEQNRSFLSTIKSLEEEVVSNRTTIENYSAKIKTLEEQNGSNENEMISLKKCVEEYEMKYSKCYASGEENEKNYQNLRLTLECLEKERICDEATKENFRLLAEKSTAALKTLQEENVSHKKEIGRLTEIVDDYNLKMKQIQETNQNLIKSLEQENLSNKDEILNRDTLVRELTTKITVLEEKIVADNSMMDRIQSQFEECSRKYSDCNKNVIELEEKNQQLISKMQSLKDEILRADEYRTKYSESLVQNNNLIAAMKSQEEEIVSCKEEIVRTSAFAEDYKLKTNETIKSLEKRNATGEAIIEEREGLIRNLTTKINSLENEAILNQEEVERLKVLVDTQNTKYCECHKSLFEEKETNQNLITKIDALEIEILSKKEAIKKLKESIVEYQTKYAPFVTRRDTDERIEKLETEIVSNEVQINKLNALVNEYNSKYSECHVISLEQQEINRELTQKIKSLEDSSVINQNTVKKLQALADEYKSKYAQSKATALNCEESNVALISKIETLESEIASNKEVIGEFKTIVDRYKSQSASNNFKEDNDDLNGKIESLQELNALYLKEIDKWKKELSWSQHMISKLNEEKEEFESHARRHTHEQNRESSIKNLQETLKMYQKMFVNVISHFIKEEKTVLLLRISPEQREYLKDIRKRLKDSNIELKHYFVQFQQNNFENVKKIDELLIRSYKILRQYWDKENNFIKKKRDELEHLNNSYVEEVVKLEQCSKCEELKKEIGNIKRQWSKDAGQVMALEIKLRKQQEKAVEVKKTETMQVYEEHIKFLNKKLESLQNGSVALTKETHNAEIQCNMLNVEEYERLQKKYLVIKDIAAMRREKILQLTEQKQ